MTPRLFQDPKFPTPVPRHRRQRGSSSSRRTIFNKVFAPSSLPSPIATTSVTVLLLPQNGLRPVLLTVRSIDIRFEGHKDNHLSHIPDMRSFWGDGEAWHARLQKYSSLAMVGNDAEHTLAGTYMLLYVPEGYGLAKNTRWQEGVSGDACIVKMGRNMWARGGVAAYEDVDKEFLETGLYREMLAALFNAPVRTLQLSAPNVESWKEEELS